eukprot:TRINITY_DN2223_c0_g1_i7.p1 TRINITY_DN2223_c0_g1~~TRINITY_DN2223_c0_g1_i7.p1  ORF type:complete len:394 (-),score=57.42 TRINITY_DN2223_c0_g1_i7:139-1320(-)
MGCATSNQSAQTSKLQRKPSKSISSIHKDLKTTLPQYSYKDVLGHGSYGCVMLCEGPGAEQVAIKALAKKSVGYEKLMNEVGIMAELKHPNIVKYIEHHESEKYLYVIMEYCSGGDLYQRILKQEKFSEDDAVAVVEELLRAVEYCHCRGVIHRDLKPENIMFSSNATLKIIDFGLSVREESHPNEELVGTRHYIAPEIIHEELFTKACDVWSLGVIVHVLLTGYLPIGGQTFIQVYEELRGYKGPVMRSEQWEGVSSEAKDLVRKMLEPDYKERITAAEALKHPWLCKNVSDMELKELQEALLELSKHETRTPILNDFEKNIKIIKDQTTRKGLIAARQILSKEKANFSHKVLEAEKYANTAEATGSDKELNCNIGAKALLHELKEMLFNKN